MLSNQGGLYIITSSIEPLGPTVDIVCKKIEKERESRDGFDIPVPLSFHCTLSLTFLLLLY